MNHNITYLRTAACVVALGLFFSVTAFGQGDAEPVGRSSLTGVSLPKGALRMYDKYVPEEVARTMNKIVAGGGGKLRQGETEVLVWTGSDLKKAGAKTITESVGSALRSEGWEFEISGTESGITFFSVLRTQPERRGLLGFFGEAEGSLVFAWTEVHAAAATPTRIAENDDPGGSVSDYSFTTPSGWSRKDETGKITLSSVDGEKTLIFLPLMDSSGNLELDAERKLWQLLKGYETWSGNGFERDYGVFERGRTAQGLEYYRAYRYAAQKGVEDSYSSRIDANILLVKLGNKVAVAVGRQPFQSDSGRDSTGSAIDLILYDLRFNSVKTPYNLKSELLGSWSTASSTVAIAYTFNPNGTFNKGGAISFRTSHDATRDKVTTTSYGMTDSYSLSGNVITQNYKRSRETYKYKIRFYETKYDKDAWQKKLGFLPVEDPDNGTIVFRRSE
jgi:hypothetical protein